MWRLTRINLPWAQEPRGRRRRYNRGLLMPDTRANPATWADILATPDDGLTYEILSGQLEAQPRKYPRHSFAVTRIIAQLFRPFDRGEAGPGGWWLLPATDVMLGPHDFVAPDVVGWRRARVQRFPEEQPITVRPDWICEVLDPRCEARDRVRKADLYLDSGIPHYWIVDSAERTLEAFAAREGFWVRLGAWTDGSSVRIPPFEAVEIDISGLYPPLAPEEAARGHV